MTLPKPEEYSGTGLGPPEESERTFPKLKHLMIRWAHEEEEGEAVWDR